MGQALYLKWRPQTFDDVIGQEHIVQTLRYALRTGHIHHAYLLAGPRGTGKTTTARLIAKAVNCLAPEQERPCNQCEICRAISEGRLMDLIEIDAASNTGVDNIRDLLEKVGFRPTQATYKVYVIDEVHMLSTAAFNALLKTLEEPPEHVIFVLATTEVHKIPETILSRCQRFEFRRIPLTALVGRLEAIAESEAVVAEPEALEIIARAATGSMRDAISLFDQLAANGTITADYVRTMLGAERREVVRSLLKAWVEKDIAEGLQIINRAIDGGADPRQLARQTADFLRGLLLMRLGAGHTWTDPTTDERQHFAEMARKADPDNLVEAIRLFSEVASKQRTGWQPQLPLELAFVEAALQTTERAPMSASHGGETTRTQPQTTPVQDAPAPTASTGKAPSPTGSSQQAPPTRTRPTASPTSSQPRVTGRPTTETAPTTVNERPAERQHQGANPPTEVTFAEPQQAGGVTQRASALDPAVVESIRSNWRELLSRIRPVSVGALLRDAEVGGTDSHGHLILAFQHTFHCGKISEQVNLLKVEEVLAGAFNQEIRVRCLMQDDWEHQTASKTSEARPAASGATPEKQPGRRQVPAIPLEEDELIRRAQEELGAVAKIND
ncbi:MAG: DNA polymerase III subunit gamma/tau [Anaerolineae bacterium]|nr:DNA polymerase III subunit gamma/tau [Anaerolineae bacterium]